MARCPAHGNRIQLNPSRAVNLFGATPQPDCRRTVEALIPGAAVGDAGEPIGAALSQQGPIELA